MSSQASLWGLVTVALATAVPAQAACLADPDDFSFVPSGAMQQVSSDHPRIFWRLQNYQAENLQISVTDQDDRELYFWDYKLGQTSEPSQPGLNLMSVQASPKIAVAPAEVGSVQNWQLTLICDEGDRTQDIVITQQIERLAPDDLLEASLQELAPTEKIDLYLAKGLVNSALTEFFNLQNDQFMEFTSTIHTNWLDFQKKAGIMVTR